MSDLKTLKDIDSKGMEFTKLTKTQTVSLEVKSVIKINDLRKEAIKHIKALANEENNLPKNVVGNNIEVILWIKHFFNITDEDLQ